MPLYSMSRAHAHDQIDKLEAKGERVTLIVPDGSALLVYTISVATRRVPFTGFTTIDTETRS